MNKLAAGTSNIEFDTAGTRGWYITHDNIDNLAIWGTKVNEDFWIRVTDGVGLKTALQIDSSGQEFLIYPKWRGKK